MKKTLQIFVKRYVVTLDCNINFYFDTQKAAKDFIYKAEITGEHKWLLRDKVTKKMQYVDYNKPYAIIDGNVAMWNYVFIHFTRWI